ncbi:MAG: hypothetical protein ACI8W9_001680, partial [Psychromonas sp.]
MDNICLLLQASGIEKVLLWHFLNKICVQIV